MCFSVKRFTVCLSHLPLKELTAVWWIFYPSLWRLCIRKYHRHLTSYIYLILKKYMIPLGLYLIINRVHIAESLGFINKKITLNRHLLAKISDERLKGGGGGSWHYCAILLKTPSKFNTFMHIKKSSILNSIYIQVELNGSW